MCHESEERWGGCCRGTSQQGLLCVFSLIMLCCNLFFLFAKSLLIPVNVPPHHHHTHTQSFLCNRHKDTSIKVKPALKATTSDCCSSKGALKKKDARMAVDLWQVGFSSVDLFTKKKRILPVEDFCVKRCCDSCQKITTFLHKQLPQNHV